MTSLAALERWIDPLRRRVLSLVGRGLLRALDEGDEQGVQAFRVEALKGETLVDVERLGEYGLLSVPPEGAEVVIVCAGGRAIPLVIATEHREKRLKDGEPGDSGVYDDRDQEATLRESGFKVRAKAGDWQIEGPWELVVATIASIRGLNIDLQAVSDFEASAGLNASVAAGKSLSLSAGLDATLEAAGEVDVQAGGKVSVGAGAALSITSGAAISIAAPAISIIGALAINGDAYLAHTHSAVESGSDTSGPVA